MPIAARSQLYCPGEQIMSLNNRFHLAFPVQAGEQASLFFLDPAGNALEFKAFRHVEQIFEKQISERNPL